VFLVCSVSMVGNRERQIVHMTTEISIAFATWDGRGRDAELKGVDGSNASTT
jgi:hypothetical protein